jgi:hypothetical protein
MKSCPNHAIDADVFSAAARRIARVIANVRQRKERAMARPEHSTRTHDKASRAG